MKLLSIEPTPSPNSMKLNVDEMLPRGLRHTYTPDRASEAPEPLRDLLAIEGVRSVFRTADFIALDRKPNADWQAILAEARRLLSAGDPAGAGAAAEGASPSADGFGEAHVLVQLYRGIPMQVRVRIGEREVRAAMTQRFTDAVQAAAGATMIRERKLEEFGIRYGEPEEIAAEIVKELEAAYPEERLAALIEASVAQGPDAPSDLPIRPAPLSPAEVLAQFETAADWQHRYAAFDRLATATPEALPLLERALKDDNASIRRLAVVYLGDLRSAEAMPLLFTALRDKSVSVRRTAGDTLSDIGDAAAIEPMIESLRDSNKLVRWRAARFLYEAGDERALESLREAMSDAEFEISLQASMAVERIERGEEAAGSVWQQMTQRNRGAGNESE
ncbi:PBS lyase HEAT domain protein repeat-containing protein [Paenibacillus curdlanolyticus YK9]|uniref:PBS lyase HEAT domain protein repeat-containing protein n=1 Tax=Paenibacillus curdlanolyticus YK9 TaxID=717606 RepID=E0I7D6_9BACL|nr:virulence factor [Paenibacillus curdlanolyticus]EFM11952.1 PBS lyase HEAT domain protein repeat-containing protein [Paenibacillus curdlanolyticus YK9]